MGVAKTLEPFVCGGSAATFASVVIHPIDLAKVRANLHVLVISRTEILATTFPTFFGGVMVQLSRRYVLCASFARRIMLADGTMVVERACVVFR